MFGNRKVFFAFFEGPDDAAAKAAADKAAVDAEAAAKAAAEGGDPKKTFTQDEVNSILAQDRKKHDEKIKKTVSDLEKLQQSKSLTDQEKTQLQTKIDELNNTLLTKEQLAAKERKKLEDAHKTQTEELSKERDTWKNRFTESSILRTISDAAATEGAFNPKHIIALLGPITQLKEETDAEGHPTGKFVPKVSYTDLNKDGQQVTLDLTVPEAVKRMKETPEEYGQLFKSTAAGGTGTMPSGTTPGNVDIARMSPDQYMKHRKSLGLGRIPSPQMAK